MQTDQHYSRINCFCRYRSRPRLETLAEFIFVVLYWSSCACGVLVTAINTHTEFDVNEFFCNRATDTEFKPVGTHSVFISDATVCAHCGAAFWLDMKIKRVS